MMVSRVRTSPGCSANRQSTSMILGSIGTSPSGPVTTFRVGSIRKLPIAKRASRVTRYPICRRESRPMQRPRRRRRLRLLHADMPGMDAQPLTGGQRFLNHLARQIEEDRTRTGHTLEDEAFAREESRAQPLLKRDVERHRIFRAEEGLLAADQ